MSRLWENQVVGNVKARHVWALAFEDLQELLRGRWSHVTGAVYFPDVDGRQLSREEILEMAPA